MNARDAQSSRARALSICWGCLAGGLSLFATSALPADEWQVPEAPVRFTLRLAGSPSHPEAGYIAQIPDGGLLPSQHPRTRVVTANGTVLDSYTLWHGQATGLWFVFADPGEARQVQVYVTPGAQYQTWTERTNLRPSPMLVADAGTADLKAAKRLAGMGSVGAKVHAQPKAGIRRAPLSVGGDDTGRPRPTSFYLHAYLVTTDPGRTWIAPFFNEGRNEVHIDGTPLTPKKRTSKWGGTGAWFDLDQGLHRVEVFSASEESGPYSGRGFQGHMYLTWQTPTMPADELGGAQSQDQPVPGTPRWDARIIKPHEIVRSGRCLLQAAATRDGGPVACFSLDPAQNFFFEGEDQLAVYAFEALREGNPDDTTYHWTLEGGVRTRGASIRWLVPGLREHRVTLTASSARGTSTCSIPFFGYSTAPTNLNNARDRLAFRLAMQTVLEAYPLQPDPCTQWSDAYWNNLLRTAEYGKGYPLLRNLLGQRARTVAGKLPAEEVRLLQDIFLDVAPRVDPAEALQYIVAFHQATPQADRRAELEIQEAEVFMIYLDQLQKAGEKLARVIRQGQEAGERAKIRLGDLYLCRGDLNNASKLYADVQQRVRHERNAAPVPGERTIESWKMGAVKDAALSATVARLVDAEEFLLARQALDQWERTFPLSKISEDFVLQEARLYMALTDWKRARWLLEPYCRTVDASSYLPDAADALIRCMGGMKESPEAISEVAVMLKKRLEFHPVAADLEKHILTPQE